MDYVEALVARAEDEATGPDEVRAVLDELLVRSPAIGAAVALGLLSREPRIKPSRRLLIDPGNAAHGRWRRRVAAASALASSPAAYSVRHELRAEFADSRDLEIEALSGITGVTGVT